MTLQEFEKKVEAENILSLKNFEEGTDSQKELIQEMIRMIYDYLIQVEEYDSARALIACKNYQNHMEHSVDLVRNILAK